LQKDLYNLIGTGIGVDIGGMVFVDIGEISRFKWLDYFALGLSINNLITTRIYWNSDKIEDIPMQVIAGIGYFQTFDHLPIKYTLLWQQNSLYKSDSQYGVEMTLFDIVSVRGGLNYEYLQGGIGLMIGEKMNSLSISIDYSFSNHDLGNAHRIGGTIYF
jgi:hypothetical protein